MVQAIPMSLRKHTNYLKPSTIAFFTCIILGSYCENHQSGNQMVARFKTLY
ncbi:hypothetical protein HanPI659440_Chr03g0130031 [Helianthus annuus]|nr:hypothetical protein HanPI659440_Chr03g0130031 [Helianthus annuus]